ncbi:MAG: adenylate/guanylate cyclase domain-containing protein [Proteobacteria bacterium]|nr:adenylate/guanylate cyclase domain-containing protein [Pseudomonadota bacterium]
MTKLTLIERRLRITTGLILATYITIHLSNHALGLISLEAMEAMRKFVTPFWRSWVGGLLIYTSLLTHFGLALMSLYRRTTLRMPVWEFSQLVLGLSIIPLLAGHIAATWGARVLMDFDINYEYFLNGLLSNNWLLFRQAMLLLVAWSHVVIGLHFFFRLFSWYRRWSFHLYPLVFLMPLLVVLSMARVGIDMNVWQSKSEITVPSGGYRDSYLGFNDAVKVLDYLPSGEPDLTKIEWFHNGVLMTFYALLMLTLGARIVRDKKRQQAGTVTIKHVNGLELKGKPGQTILEIIRKHSVPHASLCGGRGRCTTCRVRVGAGFFKLAKPSPLEQFALDRIRAAPNVRLACQTRPLHDVQVSPLLPPDLDMESSLRKGGVSGEEREVVAMFVDLRGSSKMSERHLPYDVLFILNRFFIEMTDALSLSYGHYAQFEGDGLLALYGLERGLKQGCRDALQGAVDMQARMNTLNEQLIKELEEPLKFGIGIHCGQAIVGTMGPPSAPNHSAIGDCINAASRLEGKSKELECILVVSNEVVEYAGVDFSQFPTQQVSLRGKQQSVLVFVIKNPLDVSDSL